MSLKHSSSIDSSLSVSTMATVHGTDLPNNYSNGLYEDREHFQSIFTNDSRFFDTSLHLFKSYAELGYIQTNNEKANKLQVPIISSSNGHKHRWRPRLLGLNHHHNDNNNNNGILKAFLTPTLLRKTDPSTSTKYDGNGLSPHIPTNNHHRQTERSSMIVQYQRTTVPTINITDDNQYDESEVTITRL